MIDAQELGSHLRSATRSLFRLEIQPSYDTGTDGGDFQRFLTGETSPDMERKGRWLDQLRRQRALGIYRYRVRALHTPLSAYDRYAAAWGYSYNVEAGDDTRILDLSKHAVPIAASKWDDFWLVDDATALRMLYTDSGQFIGAELTDPDEIEDYRQTRDVLWQSAEPFADWWQRIGA